MSDLFQIEDQYASYLGWYGVYGDDSISTKIEEISEIFCVYFVDKSGTKTYLKGQPDFLQGITHLESGNPYIIFLEKGTKTITIPGFIKSGEDANKLVLEKENGQVEENIDNKFQSLTLNSMIFVRVSVGMD